MAPTGSYGCAGSCGRTCVGQAGLGGHRKIWAMTRHDGHKVSQATVLQLLRDEGLLLPSDVHKQRRELAKDRKAVFAKIPNGPNQVWQLDLARVRDHNWWNLTDHGMPGLVLQA